MNWKTTFSLDLSPIIDLRNSVSFEHSVKHKGIVFYFTLAITPEESVLIIQQQGKKRSQYRNKNKDFVFLLDESRRIKKRIKTFGHI